MQHLQLKKCSKLLCKVYQGSVLSVLVCLPGENLLRVGCQVVVRHLAERSTYRVGQQMASPLCHYHYHWSLLSPCTAKNNRGDWSQPTRTSWNNSHRKLGLAEVGITVLFPVVLWLAEVGITVLFPVVLCLPPCLLLSLLVTGGRRGPSLWRPGGRGGERGQSSTHHVSHRDIYTRGWELIKLPPGSSWFFKIWIWK